MKPRQTVKNYHDSSVSPYQKLLLQQHHQQQQLQQQQQQQQLQLQLQRQNPSPSLVQPQAVSSSSNNHHHQPTKPALNVATQLRDIDLIKLGLNLDDMPNLQAANNSNPTNPDDFVKCLQALYGNSHAEMLQKLKLSALNDWPIPSISPPDFPRTAAAGGAAGLAGSSGANNSAANLANSLGALVGAPPGSANYPTGLANSGAVNLGINCPGANNNAHAPAGQSRGEIQIANSQHSQHPHPSSTTAAGINHFRASASGIQSSSSLSSKQLLLHQQQHQQQLSQQKSVLSLHQHHQNDLSNRRLNHPHHLNTTNTSYANLSAANASNNATLASTSPSDTNNLSQLAATLANKNSASSGMPSHVPNMMDSLGSIDNIFYDNSLGQMGNNSGASGSSGIGNNNLHQNDSRDPSNNPQSLLIKHQQLQKLLKATGSQFKSVTSSAPSTSTIPLRSNDLTNPRNLSTNMATGQSSMSVSNPTVSPPQQAAFSSVPKSLLNLAACSSSSTNSSSLPSGSKISSMLNQLGLRSNRNINSAATNTSQANLIASSSRSMGRNTSGHMNDDGFSPQGSNGAFDANSILQPLSRPAGATTINNSAGQTSTTSASKTSGKQYHLSLLSEDQSTLGGRINLKNSSATSLNSNPKTSSHIPRLASSTPLATSAPSSKEAFLANLQERAARAGVSMSEINKPTQPMPTTGLPPQANTISISPNQSRGPTDPPVNQVDRREIESALSRVGARNDLSLLYPPMTLAQKSQRELNVLSAGLQGAEESEAFTQEVKRIVLEECNVIYECKECKNLFRSLANLVKHKRTYCTEQTCDRNVNNLETRRSHSNPALPMDQVVTSICSTGANGQAGVDNHQDLEQPIEEQQTISVSPVIDLRQVDSSSLLASNYPNASGNQQTPDRRPNPAHESRMMRILRNQQERRFQHDNDMSRSRSQSGNQSISSAHLTTPPASLPSSTQTSLSKLLQSQPKNRLPVTRDSALIGALNMTSTSTSDILQQQLLQQPQQNQPQPPNNNKNVLLSAFDSDKSINCPSDNLNEDLVRNSSLAKTLLNEKVRVTSNPRQSLIELSRAEAAAQPKNPVKRVAPKRKFLEDCIQRVKRDKLLPDEELSPVASNSADQGQYSGTYDREYVSVGQDADMRNHLYKNVNSTDESDLDSDALMIDLDGSTASSSPAKRSQRPIIDPFAASGSSRINTSSALLKALTRPVDTTKRSSFASCISASPHEGKITQLAQGDRLAPVVDLNDEKHGQSITNNTEERTIEAMSPLFDMYSCDVCNIDQPSLSSLIQHTVEHHKEEKMVYPCIFCSFSFIALENVCRHIIDIHKKPKAQVHRLKEVVRSRSYLSSDFLACRDHPPMSKADKMRASAVAAKLAEKTDPNSHARLLRASASVQVVAGEVPKLTEGRQTRPRKRIDYHHMVNNDLSDDDCSPSVVRKSRSRSAEQPSQEEPSLVADVQGRAGSVDGASMSKLTETSAENSNRNFTRSLKSAREFVESADSLGASAVDDSQFDENSADKSHIDLQVQGTEDEVDESTVDSEMRLSETLGQKDDPEQDEDGMVLATEVDGDQAPEAGETNNDADALDVGPDEGEAPEIEAQVDLDDGDLAIEVDNESDAAEESDEESSSSSSESSSSSSSSGSSSSSSSSSGSSRSSEASSGSSISSAGSHLAHSVGQDATPKAHRASGSPHPSKVVVADVGDGDEEDQEGDEVELDGDAEPDRAEVDPSPRPHQVSRKPISSGKQISPASKNRKTQSNQHFDDEDEEDSNEFRPYLSQESDSEACAESDGLGQNQTPPYESAADKGQSEQQRLQHGRQVTQKPSSSSRSANEPSTPSSSGGGSSSGIMKLKIQLKTRPDEKSKVYEIV